MKNKLLLSTALVAASMGFAALAHADITINDAAELKTEDGSVKEINDTVYTTPSEIALENDVAITGQLTLHNAITMAGNKNLEVDGFLTETNSGSDLSGVNLAITTESDVYDKGIIIGNDLTIGNATLANKSAIAAYYTEEEYANNPAKTLTINGDLEFTGAGLIAGLSAPAQAEGEATFTLNGTGKIIANGDLKVNRATTFDLDVEGEGNLIANANVTNNATMANNVTINADKEFVNNGTLSGAVTNNGFLETNLDGLAGTVENNGNLIINGGGTLEKDVEGEGNLIANANVTNNATMANNVTINADKEFVNNGTLSGDVTNNGALTSALAGLTGSVDNKAGAFLNINGGGTLNNGMITNAGMVKFDGDYTLADGLNLAGASDFRNNVTLAGDVTVAGGAVDGTLDLQDNVWNGDVFLDDGAALAFNFGSNAKVEGDVNIYGAVDLKPTIANGTKDGEHQFANSVNITDAMAFDDEGHPILDDESNQIVETEGKLNLVENSLYNLSLSEDNTTLSIEKKANDEIAKDTGADTNQAAAISAVIDGADTNNAAFNAVANNISDMLQSGDAAQVQAALDMVTEISPEAAPAVQSVATETVGQVFSAIGTRMSGGALASASQGMSSGDSWLEKGAAWVQGLFNHAKLDKTANNAGFKADTTGIALGFEKEINDTTKAGLGYAYNQSDIKGNLRKTDVDTHTAFAYGEYKPSSAFVNGMMSYSWSDYDEKTAVAKAKYDVNALGMQVMTGYNMLLSSTTLTPQAGLRYVHVDQKSYTNSLGANIGGDKSDTLTGVLGATVAQSWNLDNGMILKPEARLALTYDIKHDAANATVLLPNGSSYTVNGKALDRFGVEAGLGLTASINDNWDVTVGYEGKFRDDYRDHSGLLNLKYKF